MNAILATLVDVLLDPTTASSREQELYERLVRAGLIDPQNTAQGAGRKPPSRREVSAARAALAGGRLASDIVSEERG